jgi:hypothetical protein
MRPWLGFRGVLRLALLGLAALALAPAEASAAWLGFRNDTQFPIVVQGASVVNGNLRRGKPQLLYPGEVFWESIVVPGKKVVEVYDPKQPRRPALHQEGIDCGATDQFFSIQYEAAKPASKGQPATPAKFKFVPDTPPGPPPGK